MTRFRRAVPPLYLLTMAITVTLTLEQSLQQRILVIDGAALYNIMPVQRDLESVLREVNAAAQEVTDAA